MRTVFLIVLLYTGILFAGQDVAWSNTLTLSESTGIKQVSFGKEFLSGICISKNPLRPVVTISVDYLPPATRVEITVYSINGRAVKHLTADKERITRGIEWNTQGVSSGVYYISVSSGEHTVNRQIVIVE